MKKFLSILFALPLVLFAGITWNVPAEFLLNSQVNEGILPNVGIDPSGNAVAAWLANPVSGAGTPVIQVSYRPVGGNWSIPFTVSDGVNPVGVAAPAVAIDNNGNAAVSWFSFVNGFFTVQTAIRPVSTTVWTTNSQVSSLMTNASDVVNAFDGAGNAVVAWSLFGGRVQSTTVNLKAVAATPPVDVTGLASVTSSAAMTSNDNGDILLVWVSNSSGMAVQAALRLSGSNSPWGAVSSVSLASDVAQNPVAAMDNNRNAVIVWNVASQANLTSVRSNQGVPSGSSSNTMVWGATPLTLTSTGFNPFPSQQVAMINIGKKSYLAAAWIDNAPNPGFNNPYANVVTKLFTDAAWSSPTTISNPAHEVEGCLSLGVSPISNPQGIDIVALWSYDSTTGYNGAIVSRSLSSGSSIWSPEQSLSDPNGSNPGTCSLAINDDGNVIGIWGIAETGTLAIQAVTGYFQPLPPTNVTGSQKNNDFALINEYYNVLNWSPSGSPGVTGYNIYLSGQLIASVGANTTEYSAHNQIKGQPATYTVTSFDAQGHESVVVTISVE